MVDVELRVVPCTYSVIHHKELGDLYFAKLYQIIEYDLTTHSFWRKSDFDDNCFLANDCGIPYYIHIADVRLSPNSFPSMYNELMNYLNYVSDSHSH